MVRRGEELAEVGAWFISEGDLLVLEDLSTTPVISTEKIGTGYVMMITTEEDHLYFAGDAPVLGHNPVHSKTVIGALIAAGSGEGVGSLG